jgi:hypothetical protein
MIYAWLIGFMFTLVIAIYSQVFAKEKFTFMRVLAILTFSAAWPLAWILTIVLIVKEIAKEG